MVWCAHDEVLGRDVAVKVLTPDTAPSPQVLQQVHREARAVAALHHRNIVEIYDYGQLSEDGGPAQPYVVMELLDGPSLAQVLVDGALPWHRAVAVCAQVAAALTAAHARGIVHRDVKPANVLVTDAEVKLVDFGISAMVGEADESDGQVLGTPAYFAPERIDGGPVSAAADVYALGLVLYRTLTGHLPWPAATAGEMLAAHRHEEPAPLPPIARLPPEVVHLCQQCLRKDPADRPDAVEAARVLALAAGLVPAPLPIAGAAASAESPTVTLKIPAGSGRRRTALALTGAAALLLTAGVGVTWPGETGDIQVPALAAPPAVAAAPQQPDSSCSVRYAVRRAVKGGFTAAVTIANTGPTTIRDWRLTFTFPAEQTLTRGWNATWRQTGRTVQARGGDLPARASASTGLDGTYRAATALPTEFRLNGTRCDLVLSAAEQAEPPTRTIAHENDQEAKNDKRNKGKGGHGKGGKKKKG